MNRSLSPFLLSKLQGEWSTSHFGIEYEGFLFNHLSHGVIALSRLGASSDRIETFVKKYTQKLELRREEEEEERVEDSEKEKKDIETTPKGTRDQYYTLLPHYLHQVNTHGMDSVIQKHLPSLIHGGSASAFHALIHLGYGYSVSSDRLVSEGLAYLHSTFLPLSLPFEEWSKTYSLPKDPHEVSFSLFRSHLLDCFSSPSSLSSLTESVKENVSHVPSSFVGFQRKLVALSLSSIPLLDKCTSSTIPVLSICDSSWYVDVMMEVFASSVNSFSPSPKADFFLLHGVTSSWAFSQISHLLSPLHRSHAHYCLTNAFLATYVAQGCPALDLNCASKISSPLPSWDAIIRDALSVDDDEHRYKLVQIAWERGRGEREGEGESRIGMMREEEYIDAAVKAIQLPFTCGPQF